MLYVAEHYGAREGHSFPHFETRTFGTKKAALSWAREKLGRIYETRYNVHRELSRAAGVRIQGKLRGFYAGDFDYVEPEVIIVPSVGELGYIP